MRSCRAIATVVCVLTIGLVACTGSAQATVTHKYLGNIEGFGEVVGLAVGSAEPQPALEPAALFVADHNNDLVNRFTSERGVLPFTCAPGVCGGYVEANKLKGTPSGGFREVNGVAVDDKTGEIYVSEGHAVDVFAYTGEFLKQITEVPVSPGATVTGPFGQTAGLTFDQETGELYIFDEQVEGESDVVDVFKMEVDGGAEYVAQLGADVLIHTAGYDESVAVAESGVGVEVGTVYVSTYPGDVDVFKPGSASGEYTLEATWTGAETPTGSFGAAPTEVGIDPVSGHVYVAGAAENGRAVDEFPSSVTEEKALDRLAGTPVGPFARPEAVTVDGVLGSAGLGDLYVGDKDVVDIFGPDLSLPEVKSEPPSEVTPRGATFNGQVSTEGETEAASCEFAWGTAATELNKVAPCEPAGVPAESELPEHAIVSGLRPDTTYFYRVEATNGNGTNTGEESPPVAFTTPGPGIESQSSADVSSTSVTLDASIDPNNGPSSFSHGARESYYFQYSTGSVAGCTPATCASIPAPPGASLGEGETVQEVEQHVQGLNAGTVYHYRVVAVSEPAGGPVEEFPAEVFSLAEGTFTTQGPGTFVLPDGRQWEMVSPPAKEGAFIYGFGEPSGVLQAAADGEAMTYRTNVPTEAGVTGYANSMQVLSTRTSAGWTSRDLASPHNGAIGSSGGHQAGEEYRFFSEDLERAVVQPFGAFEPCYNGQGAAQSCFSPDASEQTAFVQDLETGAYTPIATGCPAAGEPCEPQIAEHADVPAGTVFGQRSINESEACPPKLFCGPYFDGATADAGHVVVKSDVGVQLTSQPAVEGMYEWSAQAPPSEQLRLVSVLPDGGGPAQEPSFGDYAESLGRGDGNEATHAISEDGSRVFWSTDNTDNLYLRANATRPPSPIGPKGECTEPADACTIEIGGPGALFVDANAEGTRVFYDANGDVVSGLEECEVRETAAGLRCEQTPIAEPGSLVGISEDGSWVYFRSGAGLYVRHDGTNKLIAGEAQELTESRVSPNGRYLAFMSSSPLTGYDNRDAASGKPDVEVYLYDPETGRLTCASCDPTGARPIGEQVQIGYEVGGVDHGIIDPTNYEVLPATTWLSADLPGTVDFEPGYTRYQPRYLSNSGRLFFDSDDALVPKDIDDTWDVYEYEPEGVGAEHPCTPGSASGSVVFKPAHAFAVEGRSGEESPGCVGLISSGESSQESAFLDASESGGDVFFLTTSQLSTADFDKAYDVYDAHECTAASPCVPQPPGAFPECVNTESCRSAPRPEPGIYGSPASATFNGLGNLSPAAPVVVKPKTKSKAKPKKCAKGKARNKHGKCVKKAKTKRKKAKGKR